MLKNKSFLQGLGAGLIAGAILLQLMLSFQASEKAAGQPAAGGPTAGSGKLDEQTLKSEAGKLDMVVMSRKDADSLKAQADAAKNPSPSPSPAAAASPGPNDKRWLYILKGTSSADVEEYLSLAGVLNDRLAFRERVKADNLESKLRSGFYAFTPGEKIDDILAQITAPAR